MFIVLDFEMNNYKVGERWISDIIQIGAIKCDESLEIKGQFNEYIRQVRKLGNIVKGITGIDDSQLRSAQTFEQVVKRFFDWIGSSEDTKFITWGNQDKTIFLRQLSRQQVQKEISSRFKQSEWINIQPMITNELTILKHELQLLDAVTALNMQFNGDEHNAFCDALMTYKILLMRKSPEYSKYNVEINNELLASQLLCKLTELKDRRIIQANKLSDLENSLIQFNIDNRTLDIIRQSERLDLKYKEVYRLLKKIDRLRSKIASVDRQISNCELQLSKVSTL